MRGRCVCYGKRRDEDMYKWDIVDDNGKDGKRKWEDISIWI